jgi:tetratricopeptide (TPR) repeat protein
VTKVDLNGSEGKIVQSNIEKSIQLENWTLARKQILRELKNDPESHWLLTRLGLTFYEERNYGKALEISEQSLKLAPECPLVLWDYAGTLDQVGRENEAIKIWKGLIKKGAQRIALDECGEGIRWSKSLIIDCKYRIAIAYKSLKKKSLAIEFMKDHLADRTSGTRSIYPLRMVRQKLNELINAD